MVVPRFPRQTNLDNQPTAALERVRPAPVRHRYVFDIIVIIHRRVIETVEMVEDRMPEYGKRYASFSDN